MRNCLSFISIRNDVSYLDFVAGTRREEIARFNKAKDDKEFAKMLKARTLGPEHSETQTQLRKSIRVSTVFFLTTLFDTLLDNTGSSAKARETSSGR